MQDVLRTEIVQRHLLSYAKHAEEYVTKRRSSIFKSLTTAGAPGLVRARCDLLLVA